MTYYPVDMEDYSNPLKIIVIPIYHHILSLIIKNALLSNGSMTILCWIDFTRPWSRHWIWFKSFVWSQSMKMCRASIVHAHRKHQDKSVCKPASFDSSFIMLHLISLCNLLLLLQFICTRSQSCNTLVLILPPWNNYQGKRAFCYRGASMSNHLSSDVRSNLSSVSLNMFKSNISI